jgi:hypothetical protein
VIHGLAIWMGKSQRFPVGFPPVIRDVIQQQVGILGSSESEVVKNIVLIYFTEKGHLKSLRTEKKRQGEHNE